MGTAEPVHQDDAIPAPSSRQSRPGEGAGSPELFVSFPAFSMVLPSFSFSQSPSLSKERTEHPRDDRTQGTIRGHLEQDPPMTIWAERSPLPAFSPFLTASFSHVLALPCLTPSWAWIGQKRWPLATSSCVLGMALELIPPNTVLEGVWTYWSELIWGIRYTCCPDFGAEPLGQWWGSGEMRCLHTATQPGQEELNSAV